MIRFFGHPMPVLETRIKYFDRGQPGVTRFLHITNCIFQGDSFSAMWFCLALNLLSRTLTYTSYGYSIGRDKFLYMDDLKLYASSGTKLQSILYITLQFSNAIGIEFGLEKCRKVHLVRNEIYMQLGHEDEALIETMTEKYSYKYLRVLQLRGTLQTAMKERLLESFSKSVFSILRTSLNLANKIKAINTYAISLLTYSFGLIEGSNIVIQGINRIICTDRTGH